jgi:adenylate cyclase
MTIEPSDEIKAIVHRFNRFMVERDIEAVGNLLSRFEGLRFIGSDPAEWWSGYPLVKAIVARQLAELPDLVTWSMADADGYQCGDVGWSSGLFRGEFADGNTFESRMTAVLVLEGGQWRIVQWHVSEGMLNEYELTTSMEQLINAIDDRDLAVLGQQVSSGTVTVVFTDIEDSTGLAALMGDSRWYSLLQWHDKAISDLAVVHGGAVVKTLGDGCMLAFSQTDKAVACAQAIQSRVGSSANSDLRIRIGIHEGDSIRRGEDLFGTTVNKAARVVAVASGGETVVSDTVRDAVSHIEAFSFGPPRSVALRGLEGNHVVYSLIRA